MVNIQARVQKIIGILRGQNIRVGKTGASCYTGLQVVTVAVFRSVVHRLSGKCLKRILCHTMHTCYFLFSR